MKHSTELQVHFLSTYLNLRIGLAAISVAFPLLLWFGGEKTGIPLRGSMSEYYHAEGCCGSMRDVFVGLMFVVGTGLYLYKGYSTKENISLNIAGAFAVGVALLPMEINCKPNCSYITSHGICVFGFFFGIAFSLWFCSNDTIDKLGSEEDRRLFRKAYRILGWLLPLSLVAAYVITVLGRALTSYVFFVELIAVWTVAAYWIIKSFELSKSNAEHAALKGDA